MICKHLASSRVFGWLHLLLILRAMFLYIIVTRLNSRSCMVQAIVSLVIFVLEVHVILHDFTWFHMKMFIKVYQNNFCVQTIQWKYIKSQILWYRYQINLQVSLKSSLYWNFPWNYHIKFMWMLFSGKSRVRHN